MKAESARREGEGGGRERGETGGQVSQRQRQRGGGCRRTANGPAQGGGCTQPSIAALTTLAELRLLGAGELLGAGHRDGGDVGAGDGAVCTQDQHVERPGTELQRGTRRGGCLHARRVGSGTAGTQRARAAWHGWRVPGASRTPPPFPIASPPHCQQWSKSSGRQAAEGPGSELALITLPPVPTPRHAAKLLERRRTRLTLGGQGLAGGGGGGAAHARVHALAHLAHARDLRGGGGEGRVCCVQCGRLRTAAIARVLPRVLTLCRQKAGQGRRRRRRQQAGAQAQAAPRPTFHHDRRT